MEEIQPSSSIRCRAGKSEPGLTTKVPPVICWILREIPNPCISPARSDFKINRSKVPCKSVVGSEFKTYLLSALYRYTYRMSIGHQHLPTPSFVSEMHDFEVAPVSS